MPTRCICGAIDCCFCGPAQGWAWCHKHKQSAQYCCDVRTEDEDEYEMYDDEEPEENILNANRLDNGWY